jgi:hypothetical protein
MVGTKQKAQLISCAFIYHFTYLLACLYQPQCLFLCSFHYLYQVYARPVKTSKPYYLITRQRLCFYNSAKIVVHGHPYVVVCRASYLNVKVAPGWIAQNSYCKICCLRVCR